MTKYDPNLMLDLLRKGKELAAHPNPERRTESLDILSQIAGAEQSQEAPMYPTMTKALLRGDAPNNGKRIGEQPSSFTVNDAQGYRVLLMLEAAPSANGRQVTISGELTAPGSPNWNDFTIMVTQNAVVQDFSDIDGTKQFSLQIGKPGLVTLKIISSIREIILLEDLEVVVD